jgi:hypothetical protein
MLNNVNYGGVEWSASFNIVPDTSPNEFENMVYAFGNEKSGTYIVFDSERELQAFKVLRNNITAIFYTKTKVKTRYESLHFCFNISNSVLFGEDEEQTFNTLSDICNVHPDLLRMRLSYELYLSHTTFDIAKIHLRCVLPNEIISEILWGSNSFLIIEIATYIYQNPSILLEYIIQTFNNHDREHIIQLINELERNNYVGIKNENYYFIGRNPYKTKLRYRWSHIWDF